MKTVRKPIICASIILSLILPVIISVQITLNQSEILSLHNLYNTHANHPFLWILDTVSIAFIILALAFYRFQQIVNKNKKINNKWIFRLSGALLGMVLYVVGTLALISYDQGFVNTDLLWQYHTGHPIVIGLMALIPFLSLQGYMAEKLLKSEYENKKISAAIVSQNQRLHQELKIKEERERELLEAKSEAQAGIKAKDQFLSNMSHEIRTPMNGIVGLMNLLSETPLNAEQKKYISAIQYSSKNLLSLINQILDLSKINSEKLTLENIDFPVWETIRAAENTFKAMAMEKGIILRTIIKPGVPLVANGDPVRLNQILLNIVGNAIKFTNEGGVDIIVKSKDTDDGPRLEFHVNDTGIGIPEDKFSEIFETFTQANLETTRHFGGSGLGLAISKELVELYGGWIKVESEVGKGTSFTFEIQLNRSTEKVQSSHENSGSEFEQIIPEHIKILLAEDNRVNQLVAVTTLKKMGFKVDVANNGQEVIDMIYEQPYDLILMDVQMPVMGGLDATRFIRNATEPPLSNIKIIALTASTMREEIEKCYAVGMNDHLAKPFEPKDLKDCLGRNLLNNGNIPVKV